MSERNILVKKLLERECGQQFSGLLFSTGRGNVTIAKSSVCVEEAGGKYKIIALDFMGSEIMGGKLISLWVMDG